MQDDNKTPRQIERRTIIKGAAWSAPVIAAAVAAPMAAASTSSFDVRVQREKCTLIGASIGNAQKPRFSVYAEAGTIPTGTTFTLTVTNGLLNLGLFQDDPNAGYEVVDVAVFGTSKVYTITTTRDITSGSPLRVDYLPDALVGVFAGSNATLAFVSAPSGTEAGSGRNSDSMSVSGVNIFGIRVYSCSK